MTDTKQPNRIPAEDVDEYRPWHLPLINKAGKVLPSAEKEARDHAAAQARKNSEKVEEVTVEQASAAGLTAQQLQEIVEAGEQEGFEQGHKKGYDQGMTEGYEAGQQQGLMEMRQQLVAEQQRFHQLIDALLNPLAEQDQALERLLVDTVSVLTRSVVERELQTDSSHILALVQKAVTALPVGSKDLRISLNPDDLALVEAYAQEHQLTWQFTGDASLTPGGCKVETTVSRVDFSVEKRLEDLLEQFVNQQLASGERASESEEPQTESETKPSSPASDQEPAGD